MNDVIFTDAYIKMAAIMLIVVLLMKYTLYANSIAGKYSQARTRRSSESIPSHISEKYKRVARTELLEMQHSYDRKPMSRLTMSCKNNAYKVILSDFPFAEVRWKHNGHNFALQPSRMVTSLNTLTIQNVIPEDSGVYHCQLALGPKTHIVVAVFSVIVGENIKHVAKGESLNLKCHSYELGKIFADSTRFWKNPMGKETLRKSAMDKSHDVIDSADDKTGGKWLCTVENRGIGRKWLTARIKVIVDPAPPLLKKIRNYTKTHKVETVIVLFAATFLLVLILNCFTKLLEWKQKKFKSELDEIQKVLGINEETLGTENRPLLLGQADESSTEEVGSVYESSEDGLSDGLVKT